MGLKKPDIVIVGGGIAGASAAYELATFASVTMLEREPQLGYHSTGRSAASFTENYGTTIIRRLAIASRGFLESPPKGFAEHPLLSPRGMLTIARTDQLERLEESLKQARALVPSIHRIELAEAFARVPILRRDYVAGAFLEPDSRDIDVNGLHLGFIKGARHRGVAIVTQAEVTGVEQRAGRWTLTTSRGDFEADMLVNAAGAWSDVLAEMAGIKPLGLIPKRRTAFHVPLPPGLDARTWPMVDDVAEEFYFKPDAGQLFVSPADATPSAPVDAYPDDFDVAQGVERLERATTLEVQRVSRSWAGLRSFVVDGGPVVGFESSAARPFFWLAAQGGYGIKTSPALSRACASLIREDRLPEDLVALGIDAPQLSPARLRRPTPRGSE
jgi:D-arginine dehydrogenase